MCMRKGKGWGNCEMLKDEYALQFGKRVGSLLLKIISKISLFRFL